MALLKYGIYITYVAWRGFNKILLLIKQGRFLDQLNLFYSKSVGCFKNIQLLNRLFSSTDKECS